MKNAVRIISELQRRSALDDDELAKRIGIIRQTVNQECRLLASKGVLVRQRGGPKGKLINRLSAPSGAGGSARRSDHLGSGISMAGREKKHVFSAQEGARAQIGGYEFEQICEIAPARNPDGTIQAFTPQSRYRNAGNINLNRYGQGPFCKFKIPTNHQQAGVYAIIVDGVPNYIGECTNLSSRYNMGYGNISPRNCFTGGQETNCRLNNLIYRASTQGRRVTLWFYKTDTFKSVEQDLRALLKPEWNRI